MAARPRPRLEVVEPREQELTEVIRERVQARREKLRRVPEPAAPRKARQPPLARTVTGRLRPLGRWGERASNIAHAALGPWVGRVWQVMRPRWLDILLVAGVLAVGLLAAYVVVLNR